MTGPYFLLAQQRQLAPNRIFEAVLEVWPAQPRSVARVVSNERISVGSRHGNISTSNADIYFIRC